MRVLIFLYLIFASSSVAGQSPYARMKNEFITLFDPVPVDKGQEQEFFTYALKLYKQDSLKKAGQIFDRIYWLDTSVDLAKRSLFYRKEIESKIGQQALDNLNSTWQWESGGSNWGAEKPATASNKAKRIQLDGTCIKLYSNDTLLRQTKYILTLGFEWIYGSLTHHLQYLDNNEEWFFRLADLEGFTSDRLSVQQKPKYACNSYGELYRLVAQKTKAGNPIVNRTAKN